MLRCPVLFLIPVFLFSAGCHSAFVDATIQNRTPTPVTLVELDYPSASFGVQSLNPGQEFKYRFKVLGSGATKLLYTDVGHHDHIVAGPSLDEGDDGPLSAVITPAGVTWTSHAGRPAR